MKNLVRSARATVTLLAVGLAIASPASAAPSAPIVHGVSPQASLSQGDYELMRGAGIGVLRLGLSWNGIQPAAGTCSATGEGCDWGFPDRQIGAAAANGIEVMGQLNGSAPFVNADPAVPPTNNIPAWEQFVRSAAERYGPNGAFWRGHYQAAHGANAPVLPIRRWQIWNEPSSFQFFKPKPNTKQYAQILAPAGRAIKSVDPAATVMLGGVFGETGPKGTPLAKFFKQLYKVKGITKAFDAVAIHPYAGKAKSLVKQVAAIRKATLAAKDRKTKVWITELGYSSGCPTCEPNNMPTVVTPNGTAQAKALMDAGKALLKNRKKLNLGGIIWFSWQDVNDPNSCRFCQQAGLVDLNGQPKPAYFALWQLIG